mgnify:CR=1 FL=1
MEKILELVASGIKERDIFTVLIIFVVALVFNAGNILRYFENRRASRIQLLTESLQSPFVTGRSKEFLGRFIEQEYFTLATGIYLEKEVREALIDLHAKAKGELKFKHFKRAVPFISYQGGELYVKIDVFSWVGALYNLIVSVGSALLGLLLWVIPAFSKLSASNILSMYLTGTFLFGFGLIMFLQFLPVISAKYLKNLILKLEAEVKTSAREEFGIKGSE